MERKKTSYLTPQLRNAGRHQIARANEGGVLTPKQKTLNQPPNEKASGKSDNLFVLNTPSNPPYRAFPTFTQVMVLFSTEAAQRRCKRKDVRNATIPFLLNRSTNPGESLLRLDTGVSTNSDVLNPTIRQTI